MSIKVGGAGGLSPTGGPRAARNGGGEGFRLADMDAPTGTTQAGGVGATSAVMGVDALLALQDVGGPLERRRRAVGRASRILDVLDGIKLSLLGGELSGDDLVRLKIAIREERAATDDPRLESLLDEIETRAAVEAAKMELARRAA
jgi:hypothetical protein